MKHLLSSAAVWLLISGLCGPACQPEKLKTATGEAPAAMPATPEPAVPRATSVANQDTVIYYAHDIQASISWYEKNFGFAFTRHEGQSTEYAIAVAGSIRVILTTDKSYQNLPTVYYWKLSSPGAVEALQARMQLQTGVRVYPHPAMRPDGSSPAPSPNVDVRWFEVIDADGNLIGVTNNPIFTPKLLDLKAKK